MIYQKQSILWLANRGQIWLIVKHEQDMMPINFLTKFSKNLIKSACTGEQIFVDAILWADFDVLGVNVGHMWASYQI